MTAHKHTPGVMPAGEACENEGERGGHLSIGIPELLRKTHPLTPLETSVRVETPFLHGCFITHGWRQDKCLIIVYLITIAPSYHYRCTPCGHRNNLGIYTYLLVIVILLPKKRELYIYIYVYI